MYEAFYGFREPPFRVTPDPRFLYRNAAIDEAVAALTYGVEQRKGFLSLVGEVGTGKTTLLRHLLDSVAPSTRTVLLLYPTVQFEEMLEYILHELGIPTEGAGKLVMLQRLHEFLLEHTGAGGNAALLIDEAQDLDARVLEELRLLSNLETGTQKILQIVLAGQPELERKLAQPDLRQLRQRITLHVRLRTFSAREVAAYVRARLEFAGASDLSIFASDALERVAEVTQGIPRLVNVLCDACLVTGFATGSRTITRTLVDETWADYAALSAPDESEATGVPAFPAPRLPSGPATVAPRVEPAPLARIPEPEPARMPEVVAPPAATSPPEQPPQPEPADPLDAEPAPSPPPRRRSRGRRVAIWLVAIAASSAALALLAIRSERFPALSTLAAAFAPARAPSPDEARTVIESFREAHEQRDAARLAALFAADATSNGQQGAEAIAASYRALFDRLSQISYALPDVSVTPDGTRTIASGPFRMSFHSAAGDGDLHGTVLWTLERRGGVARIVSMRYTFDPDTSGDTTASR
jgi:general secretion pathway protein A